MTKPNSDLIEKIMQDALGELFNWKVPLVATTIGPAFPRIADIFHDELSLLRKELLEHLAPFSENELENQFLRRNERRRFRVRTH
jgi:hypothetical protein